MSGSAIAREIAAEISKLDAPTEEAVRRIVDRALLPVWLSMLRMHDQVYHKPPWDDVGWADVYVRLRESLKLLEADARNVGRTS